jgi:hypothetical protein
MNVAEFFHKLWVVSNVEIIIALLPEVLFPTQAKGGLEWATCRNQYKMSQPAIYLRVRRLFRVHPVF